MVSYTVTSVMQSTARQMDDFSVGDFEKVQDANDAIKTLRKVYPNRKYYLQQQQSNKKPKNKLIEK